MDLTSPHPGDVAAALGPGGAIPAAADQRLGALTALLENLDEAASARSESPRGKALLAHENHLVQVRLGIASSLLTALRARDAATASHCLRVALGCSMWSISRGMRDEERDVLEVAALLHDVGKIGVPDRVLLKAGPLTADETAEMARHRLTGLKILSACCASREVLDAVSYFPAWYDGHTAGFDRRGAELPLAARMIAIVDAFDSMTTDHVYRRAMPRERALAELFEFAGRQFDPHLVGEFCTLQMTEGGDTPANVARRWLLDLNPAAAENLWRLGQPADQCGEEAVGMFFAERLLESMHDAVVFVDASLRILQWNNGAERLTGIAAPSVHHRHWRPELVQLCDESGRPITEEDCPLEQTIRSGVQMLRRLTIRGRGGAQIAVNAHAAPVFGRDGAALGATFLMHDASSETTLERRVQTLHEKAIRDPLTQVANRAEFDRTLSRFVDSHLARSVPCSLIICDLDYFKRTNDTYGHQAGDAALVAFAALLKNNCRPGDLVARYGGEEFVMLCADCDNAAATAKAERIRRELAQMPLAVLGGKSVTASFGVTEVQLGDTPETMLRRADRALLQAKDSGRNRVVQLGTGLGGKPEAQQPWNWWRWLRGIPAEALLDRHLVTTVPINVAVEKLRGFIADHHAEILSIDPETVVLQIAGSSLPMLRRASDRAGAFLIEVRFAQQPEEVGGAGGKAQVDRTLVHVVIRPKRQRDRRRRDADPRCRQLLASLKSYLMAQEVSLRELPQQARRPAPAAAARPLPQGASPPVEEPPAAPLS